MCAPDRNRNKRVGYEIAVVSRPEKRASQILARHLAQDPAISLQRALILVQNPPFVYARDLDKNQLAHEIQNLRKLKVEIRVAESSEPQRAPDPPAVSVNDQAEVPAGPVQAEAPGMASARPSSHHDAHPAAKPVHFGAAATDSPQRGRVRMSHAIISVGALAGAALMIAGVLYFGRKRPEFSLSEQSAFQSSARSPAARSSSRGRPGDGRQSAQTDSVGERRQPQRREPVSAVQKRQARAFVDSARSAGADHDNMIKFYRIALSFNQYNLGAWHGLINAYRDAGMSAEARRARADMRALFGEKIETVRSVVSPYGELTDVAGPIKGTLRIEYASRARGRAELLRETYAIARGVRVQCDCGALSLYAATGEGEGMLVSVSLSPFPQTVSAYERMARIVSID
jgi:hypothetical protein